MSLEDKFDRVVARHEQLSDMLANTDGSDPQEFVKLSKEYSELNEVVETISRTSPGARRDRGSQ